MVFGDHPDDDPPSASDHLVTPDVLDVLRAVCSMLVAVILHSDQHVFPAHVQIRYDVTEFVAYCDLSLRRGESVTD